LRDGLKGLFDAVAVEVFEDEDGDAVDACRLQLDVRGGRRCRTP
jgi:hypothetical protein